jgi:cobyrinic acid a,c-diamide synthase
MNIEEKIEYFKSFLENKEYSELDIVRRFLCFGNAHIFDDNEENYFILKDKISDHYDIHPNEVMMIGSGKLGFSIAPNKDWNSFNSDSDLDMAIISEKAFNFFWDELLSFNIDIKVRTVEDEKKYNKFLKYFFKGWIRPDLFPFNFEGKSKWFNFFDELSHDFFRFGEHKISAGLYRDFKSFEFYHQDNIRRLRTKGFKVNL